MSGDERLHILVLILTLTSIFLCSAFEMLSSVCTHSGQTVTFRKSIVHQIALWKPIPASQISVNSRMTQDWIFTALIAITLFLYIIRAVLIYALTINASRVLHNRMFASVLRAPARFFDTNPSGEGISQQLVIYKCT